MQTSSMFTLMDGAIILCGIYVIYLAIAMITSGTISENGMLPKDLNAKKCKDTAAFIKDIAPKQIIFGIAAVLSGGVGVLQDMQEFTFLPSYAYAISLGVFGLFLIWYAITIRKAINKYW